MPANEAVQHAPNGMSNGMTSSTMSNPDFLARVEAVKAEIRNLTANISEIGTIHQRLLNDTNSTQSTQLENIVSQTQILNTRIKDQIKQLETDAAKSNKNQTKDSQIRTLKSNFKTQLEDYQREENNYRQRYKEQISRNYRIVNPEASEQEVREAADADWGNEGVFQTAVCMTSHQV
jgi:syntaxin 1B/2/3